MSDFSLSIPIPFSMPLSSFILQSSYSMFLKLSILHLFGVGLPGSLLTERSYFMGVPASWSDLDFRVPDS